jgi:outer membrane receptor protein involved in Fe transport
MSLSPLSHSVAACAMLAITHVSLAAQSITTIQGYARDASTGRGLPGVEVVIEQTGQAGSSEWNGRFAISRVRPGNHTIVATRTGFQTLHQRLTVTGDPPAELNLQLTPAVVELDEIVARSDRSYSAASSKVAREFDIVVRTIRSAQDLLQLAPGLVTAQHAGGGKAEQIFLRGFDADHGTDVHIAVDGVPVNMVSHGHGQGYADLHFLIPEVVQRVEVAKGPYEASYGNFATAGSVAFTTRDHLDENLIRAEAGAFNAAGVTALYQIPIAGMRQRAYLAGQFSRTDGPFVVPQDFTRFNLFSKFHTHIGKSARLAASASGFSSAWSASGQIPVRAVRSGDIGRFGAIDDSEGGKTGRQDVNVLFEAASSSSGLRLQGYVTRYDVKLFSNFTFFLEDPDLGDMIEQTDQRQVWGMNGTYRFDHPMRGAAATATLGSGFRADDIEVTLWRSPSRVRLDRLVDSGVAERNLYLWAKEELFFSSRLRLQLGARWDYLTFDVDDRLEGEPAGLPHASGFAQQSILSPKASLVFSPRPTLDLFANVGSSFHSNDARAVVIDHRVADLVRGFRRDGLDDGEIDERLTALNFDPEHRSTETLPRAVGGELGVRVRPTRSLTIAAAAWRLDLEREFLYVGDGGFTELSGRSRRHGLDLEARLGITAWLSADADLSLSHGVLRDESPGENAIPLAPRLTSTGGISALHPRGYEGSLRYVHIGDRPANEDGSVTAEGYTVLNLMGAHRLGRFRAHFAVENLLNVDWNEAQFDTESRLRNEFAPVSELHFTPGRPRNLRVGVGLLF